MSVSPLFRFVVLLLLSDATGAICSGKKCDDVKKELGRLHGNLVTEKLNKALEELPVKDGDKLVSLRQAKDVSSLVQPGKHKGSVVEQHGRCKYVFDFELLPEIESADTKARPLPRKGGNVMFNKAHLLVDGELKKKLLEVKLTAAGSPLSPLTIPPAVMKKTTESTDGANILRFVRSVRRSSSRVFVFSAEFYTKKKGSADCAEELGRRRPEVEASFEERQSVRVAKRSLAASSNGGSSTTIGDCQQRWSRSFLERANFSDSALFPCCRYTFTAFLNATQPQLGAVVSASSPVEYEAAICLGRCQKFVGGGGGPTAGSDWYVSLMNSHLLSRELAVRPCCAPTEFAGVVVDVETEDDDAGGYRLIQSAWIDNVVVKSCGCT